MNKMRSTFICVCSCFFVLGWIGCAPNMVSVSKPSIQTVDKPEYEIQFEPLKQGGKAFTVFRLTISNLSDTPLQIDWHKSPYLFNGRRRGMFVSKDSEPGNVHDPEKRFETIAPSKTYSKNIAPLELITYAYSKTTHYVEMSPFSAGPIPSGQSGIHLTFKLNNREYTERVTVTIKETEQK